MDPDTIKKERCISNITQAELEVGKTKLLVNPQKSPREGKGDKKKTYASVNV